MQTVDDPPKETQNQQSGSSPFVKNSFNYLPQYYKNYLMKNALKQGLRIGAQQAARIGLFASPIGWTILAVIGGIFLLFILLMLLKSSGPLIGKTLISTQPYPTGGPFPTTGPTGSPGGSGCPSTNNNGPGFSCHYLNPSVNIFNTNIAQSDIDFYIATYSSIFINAGKGDINEFTKRVNYIVTISQQGKLNPALFLGYWKSESLFSTMGSRDMGCVGSDFYEQVRCAVAVDDYSDPVKNPVANCARSNDANSAACNALKSIRSSFDKTHPIHYPISTFDDFAEAYGPYDDLQNGQPTNCTHTYNILVDMSEQLHACQVTPSISPTTSPPPINNVVYYCQGSSNWNPNFTNMCYLWEGGCGPTSLAMVISTFAAKGVTMNPNQVDQVFMSNGWRSCSNTSSFMPAALQSSWFGGLGYNVIQINVSNGVLDKNTAFDYLTNQGALIIGSSAKYPCVNCTKDVGPFVNHIFVVDKIDLANNTVDIRDPNNCTYGNGDIEIQSNRTHDLTTLCPSSNLSCGIPGPNWLYAYAIKPK